MKPYIVDQSSRQSDEAPPRIAIRVYMCRQERLTQERKSWEV